MRYMSDFAGPIAHPYQSLNHVTICSKFSKWLKATIVYFNFPNCAPSPYDIPSNNKDNEEWQNKHFYAEKSYTGHKKVLDYWSAT